MAGLHPAPRPRILTAMKNLLRTAVAAAALLVLAGCNSSPKAMSNPGLLADVCVMSGEKIDADSPTADFQGGKVGFCCEKCLAKWNSLDHNGKVIAFNAVKK
jgi:hypothetical protein